MTTNSSSNDNSTDSTVVTGRSFTTVALLSKSSNFTIIIRTADSSSGELHKGAQNHKGIVVIIVSSLITME